MEEVRPPYLFGRAGDDGSPVSFRSDPGAAVVEMAVHGHWTRRLGIQTSTGLRKCLAEQPGAVIADLRALSDPHGLSVSLWFSVRRTAVALDPPVEVVLCTLPGTQLTERLRRLGARRFLPAFDTIRDAREAVAGRLPLTDRLQLPLPPEPAAARAARDLVERACHAWSLAPLAFPARLVVSELVSNAVAHAGTELLVTVSRRGDGLHLSVHDRSSAMPQLRDPAPDDGAWPPAEHGRGLRLVDAVTAAWGCMPTGDGKRVWASLRLQSYAGVSR